MTWPEVTGIVSVIFVLFATWLNVRNSRDGKWSELLERHEAWQKRLEKRVGELEGKVTQIEAEKRIVDRKYGISIGHIRVWHLRHPESVPLIEVPPEILDDL